MPATSLLNNYSADDMNSSLYNPKQCTTHDSYASISIHNDEFAILFGRKVIPLLFTDFRLASTKQVVSAVSLDAFALDRKLSFDHGIWIMDPKLIHVCWKNIIRPLMTLYLRVCEKQGKMAQVRLVTEDHFNERDLIVDEDIYEKWQMETETLTDEAIQRWIDTSQEISLPPLLTLLTLPHSGESLKCAEMHNSILNRLLSLPASHSCTRQSMLYALGGGVTTDLVGYVASTFMRGIQYCNVATTVLAMSDAAIGGKTGIDTPHGKNLVGTIWMPKRVYCDVSVLKTLPKREQMNGLAEVLKCACIAVADHFVYLEQNATSLVSDLEFDENIWMNAMFPALLLKACIVSSDVRESNIRQLLNFGHTLGHAYEIASSGELLHGEAIALGMLGEWRIAAYLGHAQSVDILRLERLLSHLKLPVKVPERMPRIHELLKVMKHDKKNRDSSICAILMKSVGEPVELRALPVADEIWCHCLADGFHVTAPLITSVIGTKSHPFIVQVPGSKSLSNRVLLVASLCSTPVILYGLLLSDDTRFMMACLEALGLAVFEWQQDALLVRGSGGVFQPKQDSPLTLFVGNAGTAARFLLALLSYFPSEKFAFPIILTGNERMQERPQKPLLMALSQQGISLQSNEKGCLPVTFPVHSSDWQPIQGDRLIQIDAGLSSQYVSALLLAASLAKGKVTLQLVGGVPVSTLYVDMTIQVMISFGVHVQVNRVPRVDPLLNTTIQAEYVIHTQQVYQSPGDYHVECDASSATYPLSLAALGVGSVYCPDLDPRRSVQGDAQYCQLLQRMGCELDYPKEGGLIVHPPNSGTLLGLGVVNMEPMTDAFLGMAVLASVAHGETIIQGIANQKVKECNRIAAMVKALNQIGVQVSETDDGLIIQGRGKEALQQLKHANVPVFECFDDHRVAMSLAMLSCVLTKGVLIPDRFCVNKTWPGYWDALKDMQFTLTSVDPMTESKSNTKSIILIGLRGSGKSTMAKLIATHLSTPCQVIDMDCVLTNQIKMTLKEFILVNGWDAFRREEHLLLKKVLSEDDANGMMRIIATGGGVVELEENRKLLSQLSRDQWLVVYLKRQHANESESDYQIRLANTEQRPTWAESVRQVIERRLPLYSSVAHLELPVRSLFHASYALSYRLYLHLSECSSFACLNPRKIRDILPALKSIESGVQLLEWRMDCGENLEENVVLDECLQLLSNARLPVLATLRSIGEGGQFNGDAMTASTLLRAVWRQGVACVDVELHWLETDEKLWKWLKEQHVPIVLSCHLQKGDVKVILQAVERCLLWKSFFGDCLLAIKVIGSAASVTDCDLLKQALVNIRKTFPRLICFLMDTKGRLSRLNQFYLNPVAISLPFQENVPAAKGQFTLRQVNLYRHDLGMISDARQDYYLLGKENILNSPSPRLHNACFQDLNLKQCHYSLRVMTDWNEDWPRLKEETTFQGASVTMPFKEVAFTVCDKVSSHAEKLKAVNTLKVIQNENGNKEVHGENTDWLALRDVLVERNEILSESDSVLILGAGGTARAALYALRQLGIENIKIWNRTRDRVLNGHFFSNISLCDTPFNQTISILINTLPTSALESLEKDLQISTKLIIDFAYPTSPLASLAVSLQVPYVSGLTLLKQQAIYQFKVWKECFPDEQVIERVV